MIGSRAIFLGLALTHANRMPVFPRVGETMRRKCSGNHEITPVSKLVKRAGPFSIHNNKIKEGLGYKKRGVGPGQTKKKFFFSLLVAPPWEDRFIHTSSPSSSTTGFKTLILLSEAIVRIWKKLGEGVVDPDQRVVAAILLGRREAEEMNL